MYNVVTATPPRICMSACRYYALSMKEAEHRLLASVSLLHDASGIGEESIRIAFDDTVHHVIRQFEVKTALQSCVVRST